MWRAFYVFEFLPYSILPDVTNSTDREESSIKAAAMWGVFYMLEFLPNSILK